MSEILRAHKLIWELLFLADVTCFALDSQTGTVGLISDSNVLCLFPAGYVTFLVRSIGPEFSGIIILSLYFFIMAS